jgi:predicted nucleic acid-binding protein
VILVDTSIWIDHLHSAEQKLVKLLTAGLFSRIHLSSARSRLVVYGIAAVFC